MVGWPSEQTRNLSIFSGQPGLRGCDPQPHSLPKQYRAMRTRRTSSKLEHATNVTAPWELVTSFVCLLCWLDFPILHILPVHTCILLRQTMAWHAYPWCGLTGDLDNRVHASGRWQWHAVAHIHLYTILHGREKSWSRGQGSHRRRIECRVSGPMPGTLCPRVSSVSGWASNSPSLFGLLIRMIRKYVGIWWNKQNI